MRKKLNFSSAGSLAAVPALPAALLVPADDEPPEDAPLAALPPTELAPLELDPPLALPLVFVLAPAVGVEEAPLDALPLAPAVPSPPGSEELHANTNAPINDAAQEALANIR